MNYAGKFDANLSSDTLGLHLQGQARVETITHHATHAPADAIIVADAHLLFTGDFKRSGVDLILSGDDQELLLRDYFKTEKRAPLSSPDGAHLTGDIVTALTGHTQFAQAGGASAGKVIGHVSKLVGTATAVRNGVSIILNNGDNVEKGDVVQSGSDSTLGITFIDGTVFGLSSNARMVLNEMVYDPNGSNNSSLLSLVAGTITFVAGETAKHGDMKVDTPVATMGIRGTAVLVEVDFEVPQAGPSPGQPPSPSAKFQVLVEPDGTTGSYILFDKNTLTPIATVNQAGQQINISQGQVTITNAPLPPDIQKLINDVFSLKFTSNDSNPKTNTGQNDTITPQSGGPTKLAGGGDVVIPTFLVLKNEKGASFDSNTTSEIFIPLHVGPTAVATGGASVELPGALHSLTVDMASGVINFVDTNVNDRPTVSAAFSTFTYQNAQHNDITSTLTSQQLAAIAALELPLTVVPAADNTNNGSASWTYSVVDGAFDFMSGGEVLTLIYTATVNDGHGGTVSIPIAVTITGTNDAPLITAQKLSGAVTEQVTPAGNLSSSGAISFSDVDLSDVHLVSAAPIGTTLGTLTVIKDSDTSGTGNGGHFTWTYTVADSAVAYLAAGETKVESFTVTLDDQHGGVVTEQIDVTVTGTNQAPIAVKDVNAVKEDTAPNPISGNVLSNDTDVDATDIHRVSAVNGSSSNVGEDVVGTYGTLHLNVDGSYTYTLHDAQANVQALADGETVTDIFSYTNSDNHGGDSSATLTITVTGTNDAPGAVADFNAVKEDTPPNPVSGNVLANDTDVNTTDTHSVTAVNGDSGKVGVDVVGTYGTLHLNSDGSYTYTLNNAQLNVQAVGEGETVTDVFSYTNSDNHGGASSATLTITVTGTNDAAVIGGTDTRNLTETDSVLTTGGTLTISDVDSAATFNPQSNIEGSGGFGKFSINAAGVWSYIADSAHNEFVAGVTYTDTLTVSSADGTTHLLTVNILGTDDAAGIGGTDTRNLTETDSVLTTGGTLTVTDVDSAATFNPQSNVEGSGGFGKFSINAAGVWSYTTDTAHNEFVAGTTYTDTLTVTSADGTTHLLTVNILGTNDAAVIGGTDSRNLTETDSVLTTGGTLTISDVDSAATFNPQSNIEGSGGFGKFSINAAGVWSYIADSAHSEFIGGVTYTDTLTVSSADGTAHLLTVNILGVSKPPVAANDTNWVKEDTATSASGNVLDTLAHPGAPTGTFADHADVDPDNNALTVVALASGTDQGTSFAKTGTYGSLVINKATGDYVYTLADGQSNVQSLAAGQQVTDTFNYTISDGFGGTSSANLTVTVFGTNDAPVVQGGVTPKQANLANNNGLAVSDGHIFFGSSALSVSDVDTGAQFGIAIIAVDDANGIWQYQTSPGGAWVDIVLQAGQALLLAATDKVRFTGAGSGSTETLTFKAWDGTDGSAHGSIITMPSTVGGSSAFSAGTYTVGAKNDAPAGIAGEPINLGLTPSNDDTGTLVTVTIKDLPSDWSLNGGTHNADGSWSVQTSDIASLSVTTVASFAGAVLLNVSETVVKLDGTIANFTLNDNLEAYSNGSPIFAWSGDDFLTASSGKDLLVFAQPVGHDTVYAFDTAQDQIDLIGYTGFTSFAEVQAHLTEDSGGNALITLADGQSIALQGVHASALTASNFVFDQAPVLDNTGTMALADGAMLPLSGTVHNAGTIALNSIGDDTDLQLIGSGITLEGSGQIVLSDSDHNIISGTSSAVTLDNEDNTISGAGQLGNGTLSLTNAGTIDASGTHALTLDTGSNSILNSGVLEASGSGGMVVASAIVNSGALWANGGYLTVEGDVSGNGVGKIDGAGTLDFAASSTANVVFGAGAAGTLKLEDSFHFNGAISGFAGSDTIDLADLFGATSLSYHENSSGTGGTLTVSDGAATVNLSLVGVYSADNFSIVPDHAKGTAIVYVAHDLIV